MPFPLPPLYPILDSAYLPRDVGLRPAFLREVIEELGSAGVTLLQLREKDTAGEQILSDARVLREFAPEQMQLVLNDHVDLVRPAGFDGAHVGQHDMTPEAARGLLGSAALPDALLGLSTHTLAQVIAGDATTADYLAIGPIFPTGSKEDASAVVGLEAIRSARQHTAKPLVAIGGITLERARSVWDAGADAVAVIGALFGPARSGGARPGRLAGDFLTLFR